MDQKYIMDSTAKYEEKKDRRRVFKSMIIHFVFTN
jgi:hypothetical protein